MDNEDPSPLKNVKEEMQYRPCKQCELCCYFLDKSLISQGYQSGPGGPSSRQGGPGHQGGQGDPVGQDGPGSPGCLGGSGDPGGQGF